jgi:peroxiredoxin
MKNLLYIVLFAMMSCSTDNTFNINGDISNLSGDLLYAKIKDGKPVNLDTIKVVDGKFNFETQNLPEDDFRFLISSSNQQTFIKFFVDNSDIQIKGNADSLSSVSITGSVNHTLFENLMKSYEKIDAETQQLILEIQMAKNDEDGVSVTNLEDKLYTNEDKKPQLFIDFAKSHPKSSVSPWALLQIVSFVDYDRLIPAYNSLSYKVKKSTYSKTLKIILDEMGKTAIGAKAPEFSLPDADGKKVSLSDFKGKVVLIDFWSPMCVYCRLENPHMVELYNTYKDKGFDVLGINVEANKNLDIWKLVIEEDKLSWTQLLDNVGVADIYKVNNTPYNVLVDGEGVIIAKDIHQEDLDKKLEELFK